MLRDIFVNTVPRPSILPYYTTISTILQENINGALSGSIAPADAMKKAQEKIEQVMKKYGK